MHNRWLAAYGAAAGTAAAVVLLAACGSSASTSGSGSGGSSSPAASASSSSSAATGGGTPSTSASGIKTASEMGGTVLTTAKGFTIYWFAIDTPTKSNCNGTCATFWPPLTGTASMASSAHLTGKFGTIKRADGTTQATYLGHPLYLYKGDTAPGQVHGNGLSLSGGKWWAMTPTGAKLAAAAAHPSGSSSSGGGGYGY